MREHDVPIVATIQVVTWGPGEQELVKQLLAEGYRIEEWARTKDPNVWLATMVIDHPDA